MRKPIKPMWFRGLLAGALAVAALMPTPALPAPSAKAAVIEEWLVPWPNTRPRDPSVAPDGRVWFVGQGGNYLAVFNPASASFARFDLPDGTQPHSVLVDGDGYPWIAGNGNGTILRFDPASGEFRRFPVPDVDGLRAKDPHTFAFDGRGGLWFTLQRGNAIGHLDMRSGHFRIALVPTANALPYGIVSAADGRAWAVALGSNRLLTIAPDAFQLREVVLPRAKARPRRLGMDAGGRVWYVDFMQGYLGRYDPADGGFKEWKTPSANSGPYAMTTDAHGRAWLFETFPQPNLLQGFDMASETWLPATPVPSGGRTVRHMEYQPRGNSLWFGTDTNHLGRARLPERP